MSRSFALSVGLLLALILSAVHTSAQTSSATIRLAQADNASALEKLSDAALLVKLKALAVMKRDGSRSKQERRSAALELRTIRQELARRKIEKRRRARELQKAKHQESIQQQKDARERRRHARETDSEKRKQQADDLAEKRKQQIEKRKRQIKVEAEKRKVDDQKREAEILRRKAQSKKRKEQAKKRKERAEKRSEQAEKHKDRAGKREKRVDEGKVEADKRRDVPQADKPVDRDLAAVRALLADNRPARSLSNKALRKRLQTTRNVLKTRGLKRKLFRKLRRRLAQDRSELRDRVAARNAPAEVKPRRERDRDRARVAPRRERDRDADRLAPQRERDRARTRRRDSTLSDLLLDNRPARRLDRRQLAVRIRAARNVLLRRGLHPRDRRQISRMLRRDRAEFRDRLHARRERRRRQLARDRARLRDRFDARPPVRFERAPDIAAAEADKNSIEQQLIAPPVRRLQRRYSMRDIRRNPDLRLAMPALEIDTIRFAFGSDSIAPEEIAKLERVGEIVERILIGRPGEVYLIEGHTDAPGSFEYNYKLSQRRAEAVRAALLEYFVIPPRALEVAGFGEEYPRIRTLEPEPENRRVTLRRLTPLLRRAGR